MSENSKPQIRTIGLATLTGGLITTGSLGWALFRIFKSPRIDYKEMLMYLVSFTGGIYILNSGNFLDSQKSGSTQQKSVTFEKDELNVNVPDCEDAALASLLETVNEYDRIFAREAGARKVSDKNITSNNENDVISKYEELEQRLSKLIIQKQIKELLNSPADPQIKSFFNKEIRSSKAKFREEIISHINELKGYVQGMIDPLPLAKNIKFQSTDMTDEKRREIVIIVNEYIKSMQLKLEKAIDEFVYSMCAAGNALNNKKHEVKVAPETLKVPENNFSTASTKMVNNESYNAFENTTKNRYQMSSCQSDPSFRNASEVRTGLHASSSSRSLPEIVWTKTSEPRSPIRAKLETPFVSMPCKLQKINKPSHLALEKFESSNLKSPVQLVLNEEQMKFLSILKSELEDSMIL